MIRFLCPTCGKVLKAPEEKEGSRAHCPRCGQGMEVPQQETHTARFRSQPTAKVQMPAQVQAQAPAAAPAGPLIKGFSRSYRGGSWGFLIFLGGFLIFGGVVAYLVATGKSFTMPGLSGGEADEVDSRLTPDQQKRWLKYREAAVSPYVIAGLMKETKAWRIAVWDTKYDTIKAWDLKFDLWAAEEKDGAVATCKEIVIKYPNVQVTALIDVFTKKQPRVVSYFYHDETGIYVSPNPPNSDVRESMNKFLLRLQTDPQL